MTGPAQPDPDAVEPLRERLPIYGKLFAIGAAIAVAFGLIGWALFVDDPEPPEPLTYSDIKNAERWLGTNPPAAAIDVFLSPREPGKKTSPGVAIGYATIGVGTLLLLVGGARGGGYTNLGLGAIEAVAGGRNRTDDDYEEDEELRRGAVMKRRDPMERLRKGLRPSANPSAFWTSVAGGLYVLLGAGCTIWFG
jgi:hypothetical protein